MYWSEEKILKNKKFLARPCPSIYFLIKNNKIIYVGQSEYAEARIIFHTKNKNFDSYSIIKLEKEDDCLLSELESYYILKFLPKYNKYTGVRYVLISSNIAPW